MDWININVNMVRGEEYIDAEPVSRATWLSLMAWCCSQENGGVIEGSRAWSDRKWQQLCGVTLIEVETMCLLYGFEEDNLVVNFYPVEQEAKVVQNRVNGGKGGRPKKKATPQPVDIEGEKPCGLAGGSNSLKRNSNSNSKSNSKRKSKEIEDTPQSKQFKPPSLDEFIKYCIDKLPGINPEWTSDRSRRAATQRFETYVADDWKDGFGKQVKNWKTKAINSLKYEKPWNFGAATSKSGKLTKEQIRNKHKL